MENPPTSSKAIVGRGALWSLSNQFLGQFLVLAVFLVTARFVPKEDFGVMAVCYLVIEFFRQITIESIGSTLIARASSSDKDYNAGFIIVIAGSVASALFVYLASPLFADLLKHDEIEYGLKLTCLILLTMGLSKIHEVWLMKRMDFRALAIRSVLSICVGGGVGIYMAVRGYGLESLITQQLITSLLGALCLWVATPWRSGFKTDLAAIGSLLRFSRYVSFSAVTAFISSQTDVFFSSYYLGAAATGVYNAAKRIIVAFNLIFVAGVNSVAFPTIAAQGQHENYKDNFLRGIVYTASLTAPVYAGLAALSPDIVGLLLGETWLAAAPVISILAIGGFLSSLDQYNCNTRMIFDRPHWQFYVTTANAVTNIVVLLIFARYGLQSLAFALVAKTAILHPLSLGIAMKLTGLRVTDYIKGIFPILFCALVMAGCVAFLHARWNFGHPALNILVYMPCGIMIYGVLMLCLKKSLILDLIDIGRHIVRKPV